MLCVSFHAGTKRARPDQLIVLSPRLSRQNAFTSVNIGTSGFLATPPRSAPSSTLDISSSPSCFPSASVSTSLPNFFRYQPIVGVYIGLLPQSYRIATFVCQKPSFCRSYENIFLLLLTPHLRRVFINTYFRHLVDFWQGNWRRSSSTLGPKDTPLRGNELGLVRLLHWQRRRFPHGRANRAPVGRLCCQ